MFRLIRLLNTSIGKKLLMAVTGTLLLLFVIGHLIGNLTIFMSQNALNSYAHWLQVNPMLWPVRLGLIFILLLHIYTAVKLTRSNQHARRTRYQKSGFHHSLFFSKHIVFSGLGVLLFIIFHINHLTLGNGISELLPYLDPKGNPDIYGRVIHTFSTPLYPLLYLLGLIVLGFHLNHILRGVFQSLGFYHDNYAPFLDFLAPALTAIMVIGFALIPLAALSGLLTPTIVLPPYGP
ncbi:MAG: succinate dehydrogenase cytochrome b subunit [Gammaproteobacteria bacterium]|nr:succinate dehydrogenase cytochrome b subunit [Gammaproteobacteria bacterium]